MTLAEFVEAARARGLELRHVMIPAGPAGPWPYLMSGCGGIVPLPANLTDDDILNPDVVRSLLGLGIPPDDFGLED